jgi:hypothetical protein
MTEPLSEATCILLRQHFIRRVRRFIETFPTLDHETEFEDWVSIAKRELETLLQEDPDPICQDPERLYEFNDLRAKEPISLSEIRKWYGCYALRIYVQFIKALENPTTYDAESFKKSLASRTQGLEEKLDRYSAIERAARTRDLQSDGGRIGHSNVQAANTLRNQHMIEISLDVLSLNPDIKRADLYFKVGHNYYTEFQKDDFADQETRAHKPFSKRTVQDVLKKAGI